MKIPKWAEQYQSQWAKINDRDFAMKNPEAWAKMTSTSLNPPEQSQQQQSSQPIGKATPGYQQQSSQPIGKATLGYQLQGPPGKPYGFRNQTTGEWEWFATMGELNAAQKSQQVKRSLPSDPYRYLQNQVSGLEKAKGISDPNERSAFMRKEGIGSGRQNDLQTIEERIAIFKSRLPRTIQPTDPSKSSFSRAMQDLQNMKG
jgi:hypothetical protein